MKCDKCSKILNYQTIKNNISRCGKCRGLYESKYCKSCGNKIDPRNKYFLCKTCYFHNLEIRDVIGEYSKNRICSEETKLKISQANKGKKGSTHFLGKKHSTETKKKMRVSRLKYLKLTNNVFPNYNFEACKIIDGYGKKHGYKFQHAMNGGEFHIKKLGYFVDGYDKEKNVVIEYYEKRHKYREKRDKMRENEIKNYLNCEFIVINEGDNS